MKGFIRLIILVFLLLSIFGCSNGMRVSKLDYTNGNHDSYQSAHSEKLIKKKQKMTPKIDRVRNKEAKANERIQKQGAKAKLKIKRLIIRHNRHFSFH